MKHLFFLVLIIITCTQSFSQQNKSVSNNFIIKYDTNSIIKPLELQKEKIQAFKKEAIFDYTETSEKENFWNKFTTWLENIWAQFWNWIFGDLKNNNLISFFIEILPYLIIGGVIAFIIWLFFKLNPGTKLFYSSKKGEIYFSDDEEIIKRKDIQKLINKALENKNYRLAIRYYYLLLLKHLSEANYIEYEFDKTNNDYISEIKKETINKNFIKATTLYDYIWYGNFSVTETEFAKAQNIFKQTEKLIKPANE